MALQIRELAGWLRAAAPDAHVVLLSLFYLHEQVGSGGGWHTGPRAAPQAQQEA